MTDKPEVSVGYAFGHLTVEAPHPSGLSRWVCRCACGNTIEALTSAIARGSLKSCGCMRGTKGQIFSADMTGQVFGMLTVLRRSTQGPGKWVCKCSCGREKTVAKDALARGATKSCGCIKHALAATHHMSTRGIKR